MMRRNIIIESGKPMQFLEPAEVPSAEGTDSDGVGRIAAAIKAYSAAANELLNGKYACYQDVAPLHLRHPCKILIVKCSDGVFVRYDLASDGKTEVCGGEKSCTLQEGVATHSEFVVQFCEKESHFSPILRGPRFLLHRVDGAGAKTELFSGHVVFVVETQLREGVVSKPPARPMCIASIQNGLTIEALCLRGTTDSAFPLEEGAPGVQHFIARSEMQLCVGWQAIEVFPVLPEEAWNPDNSPLWAEMEILTSVAAHNSQAQRLAALDPRADVRKRYSDLFAEFEQLLNGPEEPIHQFLLSHPELICPTSDRQWSKVPFGATKSDFVFRVPHNDYELAEIESPARQLFRQDGQQTADLTHAISQTTDWVRYIEDNKRTGEAELGLVGISTNPRRLIVIGRSKELSEGNRRKLTTLMNDQPKLRILTYDDLLASARANLERVVGPLGQIIDGAKTYYIQGQV